MTNPNDRPLSGSRFELRVAAEPEPLDAETRERLHRGELGFLHSEETGSALDGPGVRLVFWTTGCEFRCQYCHNPDTWKLRNGRLVTAEQLTLEMEKYAPFLRMAGGGVTFSGGEPLVQDRFVLRLARAARALGLHVALDTNGFLGERLSDDELQEFDLYLLDLKSWDRATHLRVTGQSREPVIAFARRLALAERPAWVRFVLVPGLTDAPDNVLGVARLAAGLGNVERVDVLPFHQLGRFKWQELALPYPLADTPAPSSDEVDAARRVFRSEGLFCPG